MDALTIVAKSSTAAIATDAEDRVISLNEAARSLFGFEDGKIIGREFGRVFQPRDVFGNPLGYDYSLIFQMLESGRPFKNFECQLRKACGEYQRAEVSVVVVLGPCPDKYELAHIFWPRDRRRQADEVIARLLNTAEHPEVRGVGARLRDSSNGHSLLTERQQEILRLVAGGKCGVEVAKQLNISPETVRNHMRNILSRLGVHSRAEAVSVAYQQHLI
jgi:DNA-binding CsgD family transcriptional regulator